MAVDQGNKVKMGGGGRVVNGRRDREWADEAVRSPTEEIVMDRRLKVPGDEDWVNSQYNPMGAASIK